MIIKGGSMNLLEARTFLANKIGMNPEYYVNLHVGQFNPDKPSHQKVDAVYKAFVKYLRSNFPPGPTHGNFKCILSPYVKELIIATRSQDYIIGTEAANQIGLEYYKPRRKEILPHSKNLGDKLTFIEQHIQHDEAARDVIANLDLTPFFEKDRKRKEIKLVTFNTTEQLTIIQECFEIVHFRPSKYIKSLSISVSVIESAIESSDEFAKDFPYIAKLHADDLSGRDLAKEVKMFIGEEKWKGFLCSSHPLLRRFYVANTYDLQDLAVASTDQNSTVRELATLKLRSLTKEIE
jgi:hypothetical protein